MPARRRRSSTRRTGGRTRERKTPSVAPPAGGMYAFTIDASTGRLVTVESLDAGGTRRKVSQQQRQSLAREGRARVEEVLVEAFEAGIDCVLGDADEPTNGAESERDAQLRRDLAAPLMQQSPAGRLLKREVLDRAILGALLQHSADSATPLSRPTASSEVNQ